MNKLKKMLKGDKSDDQPSSSSSPSQSQSYSSPQGGAAAAGGATGGSATQWNPNGSQPAEGVILVTNLGEITIALHGKDKAPKVWPKHFPRSTRIPADSVQDLQELRYPRRHRQIRRSNLPPHHPKLHDPGR